MSEDEADPELLELLRQSLGISTTNRDDELSSDTGILADAEYIYNNAIDVFIDMRGTQAAAASIYQAMRERGYSTDTWGQHELHPKRSEGFSAVDMVNFVFTMDLLNFSFWSERSESERFQVEYRGRRWTGYKSLVACLRRALDEGVPITTPRFWRSQQASNEVLRHVFRSATAEEMSLLNERLMILREAGDVLHESSADTDEVDQDDYQDVQGVVGSNPDPNTVHDQQPTMDGMEVETQESGTVSADIEATANEKAEAGTQQRDPSADPSFSPGGMETEDIREGDVDAQAAEHEDRSPRPAAPTSPRPDLSIVNLIDEANGSAGKLVNLLAKRFPSFRDETRFDGRRVRMLKRAQIFVADLWGAFAGEGYGRFDDVDHLTMFADYRVPQMLHSLGVLGYSPPLEHRIRNQTSLPTGESWEVQLRGCSIWAVELIRREIARVHPEKARHTHAVLIDFFLYDLAKERERPEEEVEGRMTPHHRTRSIWY